MYLLTYARCTSQLINYFYESVESITLLLNFKMNNLGTKYVNKISIVSLKV